MALPRGTVTFLLTDVENSTPAWDRAPDAMAASVKRHYEILDHAVAEHAGVRPLEQGEGDSVVAVFTSAVDAVAAAAAAQQALAAEPWPAGAALLVRMGLHTGEAELRDESNYFGQAIVRAARIRALAFGGQILLSGATAAIVRPKLPGAAALVDRGEHSLTGLAEPEHIWELAPHGTSVFEGIRADAPDRRAALPEPLTPFIGRVYDLAAIAAAVREHRLVTLNGVGGCGKTRLAIETARQLAEEFDDVVFAELATARDDAAVAGAIGAALNVAVSGTGIAGLAQALAGRRALLVLDNCEQVLSSAAAVTQELLAQLPELKVLATSREPLMVPGETAWRVASLGAADASKLFVDRATRARATHAYTDEQLDLVGQICARLDGIPLAIELAAARAAALPLTRLAAGLDDRFRLLTGGSRAAMPRQQTLQASVDWSYDLLTETERVVFRRLSVFSGGFTLDAAEVILPDEALSRHDVMPAVMALADKSLVTLEDTDRYHLLETLRHYGGQKLIEAGEANAVRDRHLRWALDYLPQYWMFPGEPGWRSASEITLELANLIAALDWADDPGDVARLACVVTRQSMMLGNGAAMTRAVRRLEEVPDDALDVDTLTNSLANQVVARAEMGEATDARDKIRQLSDLLEVATDPVARSVGYLALAFVRHRKSDAEASVEAARAVGTIDRLAQTLAIDASGLTFAGEYELAAARIAELEALLAEHPPADPNGVHSGNVYMAKLHVAQARGDGAYLRTRPNWAQSQRWYRNARVEFFRRTQTISTSLYLDERTGDEESAEGALASALRDGLGLARIRASQVGAWTMHATDPLAGARSVVDAFVSSGRRFAPLGVGPDLALGLPVAQAYLVLDDVAAAGDAVRLARDRVERSRFAFSAFLDQLDAQVALTDGDVASAETSAHRALTEARDRGLLPTVARCFERLAVVAARNGDPIEAARLLGAAQRVRDETLFRLVWPNERALLDEIGEPDAAAFAEGQALTLDEAVAYAQRARGERKRPTVGWAALTPTERQVADLAASGSTNKEIAAQLLMGAETVKTHLSRVFAKLGVKNRTELAGLNPS